MTVEQALRDGTRRLRDGGIDDARRNVEWMLRHVLGLGRAALLSEPGRSLDPHTAAAFEAMLRRRLRREPLQYVLGETDFYGLRLILTPDVLIPRPETEQVVTAALEAVQSVAAPRVLDVGTGSGCIALALKDRRPDAEVVGVDVSEAALAVARRNAALLGLDVRFLWADARDVAFEAPVSGEPFDLVVSNPPYVPLEEASTLEPEVRDHEPGVALFTVADPLEFYRVLADRGRTVLRPGAWLVVECHAAYGEAVAALYRSRAYEAVTLETDWAGRPRIVTARAPG